jgi:taurine dioxygenase
MSERDDLLHVRPLSGGIGAEILGVDLSLDLDQDTVDTIRATWLEHLVVFFRDQELTPERQLAFARRMGEPMEYPFVKGLEEFPVITPVVKLEHETTNFGGIWHSDTTYLEEPPLGTILLARELPPVGGDTLFANMYLAYESLSEGMRAALDGLTAINSSLKADASATREDRRASDGRDDAPEVLVAEHPVVRTHPETGRKALFVNVGHTERFKDMSVEDSAPILQFLFEHLKRPEFSCCFRWAPGSMAMWDNRCAQHYPVNDYHGYRRVMHRITLKGDRPR